MEVELPNTEFSNSNAGSTNKDGFNKRVKIRSDRGETLERKIINSLRNLLEGLFFCSGGEEAPFSYLRESELRMPRIASHKVPRLHSRRTKVEMNVWNDASKLMRMFGMTRPKLHKIIIKDNFCTNVCAKFCHLKRAKSPQFCHIGPLLCHFGPICHISYDIEHCLKRQIFY